MKEKLDSDVGRKHFQIDFTPITKNVKRGVPVYTTNSIDKLRQKPSLFTNENTSNSID